MLCQRNGRFWACWLTLSVAFGCDNSSNDAAGCTDACGGGAGTSPADDDSNAGAGGTSEEETGGVGGNDVTTDGSGGVDAVAGTGGGVSPGSGGGNGGSGEPEAGGNGGSNEAGVGGLGNEGLGGEGSANGGEGNDAIGGALSGGAGPSPDPNQGGAAGASEPDDDETGPSSSRLTMVPVGSSDATLGYWEYLPPDYGDEPVPLLVFTHGAAWQGDGSETDLLSLLEVGPPNLIAEDEWPNERPFVVLSPQNPRSGCFDPGDINDFYHYAVETYNIDPDRIYHTGQSCGAIGAWGYLAEHLDEYVTAAVLISGDGRDAVAQAGCDLGRIAIWALHNLEDPTVPPAGTEDPINTLLACDPVPDVQATIYDDGSIQHDAWTKTYDLSAGHDIYSWLLEHVHP